MSTELREEDKIKVLLDIEYIARCMYKNFEWTADGIDQLGDAIVPPPSAYKQITNGKLHDDCDGFHAAMHHILTNNGIENYLLTAVAFGGGHCLLIFKYKEKWYILDYTTLYGPEDTAADIIKKYDEKYPKKYETRNVFYNGIVKYSYETGKFKGLSVDILDK